MTDLHLRRVTMIPDARGPDARVLPGRTLGELWEDGYRRCYTLEDPVRPTKIPGVTAIPAGRYRVTISRSPRFGVLMPEIHDVPGFLGVRIHTGNRPEDTEGCLLVGRAIDPRTRTLVDSRAAYAALYARLVASPGWITITDDWRDTPGPTPR